MKDILIPISVGELFDKLTILQIKSENINDPNKKKNIDNEKKSLQQIVDNHIVLTNKIISLQDELLNINKQLWKIEDDIRACERASDFGETFIKLARAVYVTNDKRAKIKRGINLEIGSRLIEEKSYADY